MTSVSYNSNNIWKNYNNYRGLKFSKIYMIIFFISIYVYFIYFSVNGIFETKNPKVFFISNEIFYVLS